MKGHSGKSLLKPRFQTAENLSSYPAPLWFGEERGL